MKSPVLVPRAQGELRQAAGWYQRQRPGLGEDFVAEVARVLEDIGCAPKAFPLWCEERPYRKAVLARFPYVVFFLERADEVRILAIAHGRRRPGYWLGRDR